MTCSYPSHIVSELQTIWNQAALSDPTNLPPPFPITNSAGCSIKISNQSPYWLKIIPTQNQGAVIDRVEPFSYLITPNMSDITIAIDTAAPTSSLLADHMYVEFSTMKGAVTYSKGSTNFSGSSNINQILKSLILQGGSSVTVPNAVIQDNSLTRDTAGGKVTTATTPTEIVLGAKSTQIWAQNLMAAGTANSDVYLSGDEDPGMTAPIVIQPGGQVSLSWKTSALYYKGDAAGLAMQVHSWYTTIQATWKPYATYSWQSLSDTFGTFQNAYDGNAIQ